MRTMRTVIAGLTVAAALAAVSPSHAVCPHRAGQARKLLDHSALPEGVTIAMAPPVCAKLAEGESPSNDPAALCEVFGTIYSSVADMWQTATNLEKVQIMGPTVRITFHDPGEFDRATEDNRGPDGCLSTAPGNGSGGLIESDSFIFTDVEPLWQTVCDVVGRGDFWNMYGRVTMEISEAESNVRLGYTRVLPDLLETRIGRIDATGFDCDVSRRLPDAMCADSEVNFVDMYGLTAADGVALIGGGHTVGVTDPASSGFGPVTPTPEDPTPPQSVGQWVEGNWLMNNEFFSASLLQGDWHLDPVAVDAIPGGNQQWVEIITIDRGLDSKQPNCESGQGPCGSLKGFNLLNSDIGLAFDVYKNQENEDGTGTTPIFLWQNRTNNPVNIFPQPTCLALATPENSSPGAQDTPVICGGESTACGRNMEYKDQIDSYADTTDESNLVFMTDFATAWNKVTTIGYGGGEGIDGKPDFKLGPELKLFDVSECRAPLPDFSDIIAQINAPAPAPAPAPSPESSAPSPAVDADIAP